MSVLRERLQAAFDTERAVAAALNGTAERLAAARSPEDDAKRLRGIPCVGGPLGGHIPGTRPGITGKLGRWSGR